LEDYFNSAPQSEIEADVHFVNSIGPKGVSFERYVEGLNDVAVSNLLQSGVIDDIAYSDYFNNSIQDVQMGNLNELIVLQERIIVPNELFLYSDAEVSVYANAA